MSTLYPLMPHHYTALKALTNVPNIPVEDLHVLNALLPDILGRMNVPAVPMETDVTEDEIKDVWVKFGETLALPNLVLILKHYNYLQSLIANNAGKQVTAFGPNPRNPDVFKTYIGNRIVKAVEMNLGQYNYFRGFKLPVKEDPRMLGYLVKYTHRANNVEGVEGYCTWMPKEAFEAEHRTAGELTFGDALYLIERGERVMRNGWNGKGMFIEIRHPEHESIMINGEYETYTRSIHMVLVNTKEKTISNWVASSTDSHAQDWDIFEEKED